MACTPTPTLTIFSTTQIQRPTTILTTIVTTRLGQPITTHTTFLSTTCRFFNQACQTDVVAEQITLPATPIVETITSTITTTTLVTEVVPMQTRFEGCPEIPGEGGLSSLSTSPGGMSSTLSMPSPASQGSGGNSGGETSPTAFPNGNGNLGSGNQGAISLTTLVSDGLSPSRGAATNLQNNKEANPASQTMSSFTPGQLQGSPSGSGSGPLPGSSGAPAGQEDGLVQDGAGSKAGMIAGGIVGGFVALGLVCFLVIFFRRRGRAGPERTAGGRGAGREEKDGWEVVGDGGDAKDRGAGGEQGRVDDDDDWLNRPVRKLHLTLDLASNNLAAMDIPPTPQLNSTALSRRATATVASLFPFKQVPSPRPTDMASTHHILDPRLSQIPTLSLTGITGVGESSDGAGAGVSGRTQRQKQDEEQATPTSSGTTIYVQPLPVATTRSSVSKNRWDNFSRPFRRTIMSLASIPAASRPVSGISTRDGGATSVRATSPALPPADDHNLAAQSQNEQRTRQSMWYSRELAASLGSESKARSFLQIPPATPTQPHSGNGAGILTSDMYEPTMRVDAKMRDPQIGIEWVRSIFDEEPVEREERGFSRTVIGRGKVTAATGEGSHEGGHAGDGKAGKLEIENQGHAREHEHGYEHRRSPSPAHSDESTATSTTSSSDSAGSSTGPSTRPRMTTNGNGRGQTLGRTLYPSQSTISVYSQPSLICPSPAVGVIKAHKQLVPVPVQSPASQHPHQHPHPPPLPPSSYRLQSHQTVSPLDLSTKSDAPSKPKSKSQARSDSKSKSKTMMKTERVKLPPALALSKDALTPSLWIDEDVLAQFEAGHPEYERRVGVVDGVDGDGGLEPPPLLHGYPQPRPGVAQSQAQSRPINPDELFHFSPGSVAYGGMEDSRVNPSLSAQPHSRSHSQSKSHSQSQSQPQSQGQLERSPSVGTVSTASQSYSRSHSHSHSHSKSQTRARKSSGTSMSEQRRPSDATFGHGTSPGAGTLRHGNGKDVGTVDDTPAPAQAPLTVAVAVAVVEDTRIQDRDHGDKAQWSERRGQGKGKGKENAQERGVENGVAEAGSVEEQSAATAAAQSAGTASQVKHDTAHVLPRISIGNADMRFSWTGTGIGTGT